MVPLSQVRPEPASDWLQRMEWWWELISRISRSELKGYTDSGGVWQDVLPHKSWGTSAKDRWDWSWQKARSCTHFLWWFLAPSGPEHSLWDFEPCKGDMSLRLVSLDDVCCWTCVIPQRDLSFICFIHCRRWRAQTIMSIQRDLAMTNHLSNLKWTLVIWKYIKYSALLGKTVWRLCSLQENT